MAKIVNSEKLRELIASIEEGTWKLEEGASVITDEQLTSWLNGASIGHRNAVPALLPLHPALRPLAVKEGTITMNMAPGWNFSGAVAYGAQEIAAGRCDHIEMNQAIIESERA